jgi:Protein of unknown function (DUF4229)
MADAGESAAAPRVLPWLLLYTLGRLVIAVVLISLIWIAGLPGFPALLFGLLLSMPTAYVTLRPWRDRLTEGLVARRQSRQRAKADLRDRLSGDTPE